MNSTFTLGFCLGKPSQPQGPRSEVLAGHRSLPELKRQRVLLKEFVRPGTRENGAAQMGSQKSVWELWADLWLRTELHTRRAKALQGAAERGCHRVECLMRQLSAGRLWSSSPAREGCLARLFAHFPRPQKGIVTGGSNMPSNLGGFFRAEVGKIFSNKARQKMLQAYKSYVLFHNPQFYHCSMKAATDNM